MELKEAIIGKTKAEIQDKYNNGILEEYILENCKSIKTIKFGDIDDIDSIIFEFEETEYDFCEWNSVELILDENNTYIGIHFVARN